LTEIETENAAKYEKIKQKYAKLREQSSCKDLEELVKLGIRRGYAPQNARFWAKKVWQSRMEKKMVNPKESWNKCGIWRWREAL
jgi:hypothetical protein